MDEDSDAVFRALADRTRRLILADLSRRSGQTLYEICSRLLMVHKVAITRQAISKHLSALEDAHLITTGWSGRQKLHYLSVGPLRDVVSQLSHLIPMQEPSDN
jgi:DNA-binding transcriptional ArsR family regulator